MLFFCLDIVQYSLPFLLPFKSLDIRAEIGQRSLSYKRGMIAHKKLSLISIAFIKLVPAKVKPESLFHSNFEYFIFTIIKTLHRLLQG